MGQLKRIITFWTDDDGFSAKDFLMVMFGGLFALQQIICFILSIMGKLPPETLDVALALDGIVITIVGGVFSVQVVQEFKKKNGRTVIGGEPQQGYQQNYGYQEPIIYDDNNGPVG